MHACFLFTRTTMVFYNQAAMPDRWRETSGEIDMKRLTVGTLAAGLLLVTMPAKAAVVTAVSAEILDITSYPTFGGGDVVVRLKTSVTGCEGGAWLKAGEMGFDQTLSLLLNAHMSGRHVDMYMKNDDIWNGSASRFCKLDAVTIR